MLRCLGRTAITRSRWLYTYHHHQGLKPGDISRKLQQEGIKATGRGIAKFFAKFIESGSVSRKPGSGNSSKQNGADRGTERNGLFYAVFRKMLSPCNANGTGHFLDHFSMRTVRTLVQFRASGEQSHTHMVLHKFRYCELFPNLKFELT